MRINFHLHKKNILITSLSSFLTTVIIMTGYLYFFQYPKDKNLTQTPNSLTTFANQAINTETVKNIKSLGILLLGYGGAGHDGGFLTDAIQIFYLDKNKKTIYLISIPRDLWVKSGNKEGKINGFLLPGTNNNTSETAKTLIQNITGLKIDYFIGIDFVGFMRTIGIELKGVDVMISETLDDPWYPIAGEELNTCGLTAKEVAELSEKYSGFELEKQFPCRYEHIHFDKGLTHMEGGEAFKYVRSRHGSGEGDVSRGKRQQEVLLAIKDKLLSLNILNNIPGFYEQFTKHVQTDLDLQIVQILAPLFQNSTGYKIANINLSTTNVLTTSTSGNKQAILIPKEGIGKWEKVKAYIKEQ